MKQEIRKALMGTGVMLGDGCLELVEADGRIFRMNYPELPTGTERQILEAISHFVLPLTEESMTALRIYARVTEKIKKIWERKLKPNKTYKMGPAMAPEAAKPCGRAHRRPSVTNKNRGKRFSPVGQRIDKVKREMPFKGGIYISLENGWGPACL